MPSDQVEFTLANHVAKTTQGLATRATMEASKLSEDCATNYREAHGKWPEYVWTILDSSLERIVITAHAGDEPPPGVMAVHYGVLNSREVTE